MFAKLINFPTNQDQTTEAEEAAAKKANWRAMRGNEADSDDSQIR